MRVQWGKNYRTFTIRYKRKSGSETEFSKRIKAINGDQGFLFPHLTVQAYLDKRGAAKKILGGCVVRTVDLYKYAENNIKTLENRMCPEGNTFIVVPFDDISRHSNVVMFDGELA
jgi:hypothetical protein